MSKLDQLRGDYGGLEQMATSGDKLLERDIKIEGFEKLLDRINTDIKNAPDEKTLQGLLRSKDKFLKTYGKYKGRAYNS